MPTMNANVISADAELPRRRGTSGGLTGIGLRVRVLLRQSGLNRMLARGIDPSTNAELTLRARQITRPAYRRTLADSLDGALSIADGHARRASVAPVIASRDLRAARAAVLGLSSALRQEAPVHPMGVALTLALLTDGGSPLYVESHEDALWLALRQASAALEPRA